MVSMIPMIPVKEENILTPATPRLETDIPEALQITHHE